MREHARGSERYGLVASSGAQRLKPHAIDVRVNVNPVHWFVGLAAQPLRTNGVDIVVECGGGCDEPLREVLVGV